MNSLLDKYRVDSDDEAEESSSLLERYREKEPDLKKGPGREASFIEKITPQNFQKKEDVYSHYKTPIKTKEDLEEMSFDEKRQYAEDLKTEREYLQGAGVSKGFLSGSSFGLTERIPGLKPEEEELSSGFGEFAGMAIPYNYLYKAISYPFQALTSLSKVGNFGLNITKSGLTGAAGATLKETFKEGEFEPLEVAKEAALFAGMDALFRGSSVTYKWLKSLNPSQQAEILVDGMLPKKLDPDRYKVFENEIVPELQNIGKQEYEQALKQATETTESEFQKKMSNVKAKHENDLYELSQKKDASKKEFEELRNNYEKELRDAENNYEYEKRKVQEENSNALKEFEQQKKSFELQKSRQQAVKDAINPKNSDIELKGRVKPEGEDMGIRPAPSPEVDPSLKNKVGNIFSENEIENTYEAGQANMQAVRATDNSDYIHVQNAYKEAEALNSQVELIQPNLINDLKQTISEFGSIPDPSTPQKQIISTAQKVLDNLAEFDELGNVISYKPIKNKILLEQAKALRYSLDYDFAHANPKGIFNPTINALEEAAETAANFTRNDEAYQASKRARALYREWADLYQNDYIRPYRNTSNKDFSKTFKSSLNVDEYLMIDRVLSRSNAGQQLSNVTKRSLIEKELSPFFENPKKMKMDEFNTKLKELKPIINQQEEHLIRQKFNEAKKTNPIKSEKLEFPLEEPKKPKLHEVPEKKLPEFKGKEKKHPEITKVEIPARTKIKPTKEMQAASKIMKITPEEAIRMSDTPTGMKNLKSKLNKTDAQKKLFEKIGDHKLKDILHEGNVKRKFTGGELKKILNKQDNYSMISEILGEEEAANLLEVAEKIESKRLTLDTMKKYGAKVSTIKAALLFGVI